MDSIFKRRFKLDMDRSKYRRKVMEEYNKDYYNQVRKLHKECEETIGHDWTWTGNGPTGIPWFICSHCGKQETRDE